MNKTTRLANLEFWSATLEAEAALHEFWEVYDRMCYEYEELLIWDTP